MWRSPTRGISLWIHFIPMASALWLPKPPELPRTLLHWLTFLLTLWYCSWSIIFGYLRSLSSFPVDCFLLSEVWAYWENLCYSGRYITAIPCILSAAILIVLIGMRFMKLMRLTRSAYNSFLSIFTSHCNNHFPLITKTTGKSHKDQPWITQSIVNSCLFKK